MSIFKRIWDAIKSLLDEIPNRLPSIIDDALKVTTVIREKLQGNVAVLITDLIPGDWDDNIREGVIAALDQTIPLLSISQECGTDVQCWGDKLAQLPQDLQDAILIKLAAKIVAALDDNKLPQNRYDFYTQAHLSGKK